MAYFRPQAFFGAETGGLLEVDAYGGTPTVETTTPAHDGSRRYFQLAAAGGTGEYIEVNGLGVGAGDNPYVRVCGWIAVNSSFYNAAGSPNMDADLLSFWDGATEQFRVVLEPGGQLAIVLADGSSTKPQATALSPSPIQVDTWHFIEVYGRINTTVGNVDIWVDGVKVLENTDYSPHSYNNAPSGTQHWDTFRVGHVDSTPDGGRLNVDDFWAQAYTQSNTGFYGKADTDWLRTTAYRSTLNSATPDGPAAGGDDLNSGTWANIHALPWSDATQGVYTSSLMSGWVRTDDEDVFGTSVSPQQFGGPSDDPTLATGTYVGIIGLWRAARGNGGGTTHWASLGQSETGAKSYNKSLATSQQTFRIFAEYGVSPTEQAPAYNASPLEYAVIGGGLSGAQDLEMAGQLVHAVHYGAFDSTNYGTLAATETGADTAAFTGDVVVQGDLAATDAADTAAFAGNVVVQGDLAATESGADTAAFSGTVTDPAVTGDLAATETGADTAAFAGDVLVQGDLAATETGADTAALAGDVLVQGDLAATEAGDTAALDGGVLVQGDLAATEAGADTAAFTGGSVVQGDLAATEAGADTAALTGDVVVQGDLAATEAGADTAALAGDVLVQGDLAATEAADTAALSGQVLVVGDLAATETGADIAAFSGGALAQGDLAATEAGADTAALSGDVVVQGDLAATEAGADAAAFAGDVAVQGDLAATEAGADAAALSGSVIVQGDLAATEAGADTAALSGSIGTNGDLAATEAPDTAALSGGVLVQGDIGATEGTDSADFRGPITAPQPSTGGGQFVWRDEVSLFDPRTIVFPVVGNMAASEAPDTASMAGQVLTILKRRKVKMAATEAADHCAATGTLGLTAQQKRARAFHSFVMR